MNHSFLTTDYESKHDCVSWRGLKCRDNEQFTEFLIKKAANRLDDTEGSDEFRNHLNGLMLTGLGQTSLAAVLNADQPEERAWAAGEALAEAFLEEDKGVVFPWNMERDKRNPFGSLPGADIVGFVSEGENCRFALGEVKCSSEQKSPPQIMSGRSGHMGHQLDTLANDLSRICQLLKWLLPRVKNTQHQNSYDTASISFFNSKTKSVAIFGVLIRDTAENEKDLSVRGNALRKKFTLPTTCNLIALYLPWPISALPAKIRNGGVS
jgi:hypothetical protein